MKYYTYILVGENIGKFSEVLANCQSFLPLIYLIFNIHVVAIISSFAKFSPNLPMISTIIMAVNYYK